jgi:molybdopterin-containing oxidoreductase family iron-sulfur binding subunit
MKITRKEFLRGLGLSALAAGAGKALATLSPGASAARATKTPAPGQRWGMAIDFMKCRADDGCNQCLSACRRAHNVPDIPDPAHEVKWIWKEPFEKVFPMQQNDFTRAAYAGHPLPLLCNHCTNPACTRVCPTQATWKRDDGVVMMDWHRCIGCRYCMAACPYGSRSFNWVDPRKYLSELNPDFPTRTKGVVEKCNFCEERLAQGKTPACVEKCEQQALVFGDLNDPNSPIRALLKSRYAIQRQPELGTGPAVYYVIG